jgi:4,5-DOPA dioxygenase extradiol
MLPTLFVTHGAPDLALHDVPARQFLQELGASLPRPKAIVSVTAHWESSEPLVGGAAHPATIHDFGGFDRRLFQIRYPAPGDPALAERVACLLKTAGLPAAIDGTRGLDHGVWVPLLLMYPDARIPVVPLSIQPDRGPEHHLKVGRALQSLRNEDILVLASGSFTHDLRRFRGQPIDAETPADVAAFADWFAAALAERRMADLLGYRGRAPHAKDNHPTDEHLLPLFVALGAAGSDFQAERLHASATYGFLRMDAFAFT